MGSDSGKRKRTVLVVDDESDIVDMVKSYLEMSGYLVMTASTGKRALEQAKRGPDAIILDRACLMSRAFQCASSCERPRTAHHLPDGEG